MQFTSIIIALTALSISTTSAQSLCGNSVQCTNGCASGAFQIGTCAIVAVLRGLIAQC